MLALTALGEAAHLLLEEALGAPELHLRVSEAAIDVTACLVLQDAPAHARPAQVRFTSDLLHAMSVGTLLPVPAAALQEELAHVCFEQLHRMPSLHTRVRSGGGHICCGAPRRCFWGTSPFVSQTLA